MSGRLLLEQLKYTTSLKVFSIKIARNFNFQPAETASTHRRRRNLHGFRYKVAKEDEVLKRKYKFYREDGEGWMYAAHPNDSELRFWADDFLARVLNEAERRAFVKKLGDNIETMLLEAKEVLKKCQFA